MSRPLLKSLPTAESQVLNHPAANKMEVLCVPQRELLKACAARNVDDTHHAQHPGGVGKEIPLHVRPWVEKMTPRMKNDVLMRASGWWACGRNECFVVMQDKFDWKNIPLPIRDFNDHISLDRPSNVLSFTYTDIDSCINRFIIDWERIYMMANLARQCNFIFLFLFGNFTLYIYVDNTNLTLKLYSIINMVGEI
ncbi:hypothetical protein BDC45DRAFT_323740 [Circinella umbellata]|nr:hypothetical protein BDC45DRAFT_323740 [Circinella umbellata]